MVQIVEDAPEVLGGLLATAGKSARDVGKMDVANAIDAVLVTLNLAGRMTVEAVVAEASARRAT